MKKLIFALSAITVFQTALFAQGEVTVSSGTTSTIETAFTTLSNNGTVFIKGNITIDNNLTVPSGIVLDITKVGSLTIQSGKTVTLQGGVRAGLYQIFISSNTTPVVFNTGTVKEIDSEWFGDDDVAVSKALRSAGQIPVKISRDRTISNRIKLSSNQTLRINDGTSLRAASSFSDDALISNIDYANGNENIKIFGGTFIRSLDTAIYRYGGIRFINVKNSRVSRVRMIHVGKVESTPIANISMDTCTNVLVDDVYIDNAHSMGVSFVAGSNNVVRGGIFKGCFDSGIAFDNSPQGLIDGAYVDHCGVASTGASNMSLNSMFLTVVNCTSKNAPHDVLGYGMVFGHDSLPASYSICKNNVLIDNRNSGIIVQGSTDGSIAATTGMLISGNIVKGNGVNNNTPNTAPGGIVFWGNQDITKATNSHTIRENTLLGNKNGVYVNAAKGIRIEQNTFIDNTDNPIATINNPQRITSVNNIFSSLDYRHTLSGSKDFELGFSAGDSAQLILTTAAGDKRLILGYDGPNDTGVIQALEWGVTSNKNLALQKLAGFVSIGNTVPTEKLHVHGSIRATDGKYNGGHFVLGNWHLWIDNSNNLRGKNGVPTAQNDGSIIATP